MENKFFQKAKLATAIALVSTTTLLTGCLVDGNKSNSNSTSTTSAAIGNNGTTNSPTGSLQGIVQDTNGNPIAGATVYVGNKTATTNAGGTYQLDDVAVTGIEITNDNDYLGGSLRVVIVPPAGYLGAIVEVEPSAVIDHGRSDQGTTEETGTANTNRFIDGFTAVAGDAVLPAIGDSGATVTGVLRDNVTHEAVINQTVNLELKSVNGGDHTSGSNAISYTTLSYQVTTDATGNFTITGAPNDSDLTFIVGGYNVNSVDANVFNTTGVLTNDEVERIHVGNVYVTAISNDDNKAPFVTAIEEVSTNAARGKLHDDSTNVLTIHFSEQVQDALVDTTAVASSNSVIVRDVDSEAYIDVTVAVAADNRSMTLTAASDFTAGSQIDIYLLKVDFQDVANNLIDDDDTLGGAAISYDFDNVNGNGDYLKLQVEVYRELNQDAAIVTAFTQLATDSTPERTSNLLDNASSAFADVNMSSLTVQQLNSADDDDTASDEDAKERLAALVVALDKAGLVDGSSIVRLNDDGTPMTGNIGITTTFEVNTAGVKFTPSNATSYRYWVERDGAAVLTNIVLDTTTPDAKTTNTTSNFTTAGANQGFGTIEPKATSTLADFQATDVAFTITLVEPGDVIYIQSIDGFGNTGSTDSLVLADNVPATTGVQAAYGESNDLPSSSTIFGEQYGNGAELANPDAVSLIGAPLLNINAGMLADNSEVADATPSLEDLYNGNVVDAGTDLPFIALAAKTYDKTAYDAWVGSPARTIAVSFTEDIAWVTPAADTTKPAAVANQPTETVTAGLSNWTIMNDVTKTSDAQTVNVDLAAVTVDNIFTLANTDGQTASVFDFTDVITDVSSVTGQTANISTAAANAKVVINDAMPPVLTQAVYKTSGASPTDLISILELTFNEPVKVDPTLATPVVTLGGVNILLDPDTVTAHNGQPAAARNVLSIPFETISTTGKDLQAIDRDTVFNLGLYTDGSLTAAAANDIGGHATLIFSNVQDDFGNTWAADSANLTAPKFAAFDAIGDFAGTPTPTALSAGGTTATIVYNFTHAVDLNAGTLGTVVNLDNTGVAALFEFVGATNTIAAATTGQISADRTQITISLTAGAALASGDSFDFTASVSSLWDSVDTVNINAVSVP